MKRSLRFVCAVLGVALLVGMLPASALATEAFRYSGKNADAWYDEDLGDGAWRYVGVFAGQREFRSKISGSKPERASEKGFSVDIYEYHENDPEDYSDDHYRQVSLWVSPYDAGIDRSLTRAHVSGVYEAEVREWTGEWPEEWYEEGPPITGYTMVDIDLTWTGTSPLYRSKSKTKAFGDGFSFKDSYNSTYRSATVSGYVCEVGGWCVDGASMWGSINDDKSGTIFKGDWWY